MLAVDLADACSVAVEHQLGRLWGLVDCGDRFELDPGPRLSCPEDLIGIDAPAHWAGMAVAFPAVHTDYSVVPPASIPILFGFAIDRSDRISVALQDLDGRRLTCPDTEFAGHIPDVCRRALGLPTDPEPSSPASIAITSWVLDAVDAAADSPAGTVTWTDLAALHPLAGIVSDGSPEELAAATRADAGLSSWESARHGALSMGNGLGGFSHDDLLWLDGPSLGRFILRHTMSLGDALWLADIEIGTTLAAQLCAAIPDELVEFGSYR